MSTFVGSERQYTFNLIVKYFPMGVIAALLTTVGPLLSKDEQEINIILMLINMVLYSGLPVMYFTLKRKWDQGKGRFQPVTIMLDESGILVMDGAESKSIDWDQVRGINVKGYFHRVVEFAPESDFFFDYYHISPSQRRELFELVHQRISS